MRGKLSVQLGALILATNLLFLSLCFFFQYVVIGNVLRGNYEDACIERFEQAEYNINNFCEQMELVSRRLSADMGLTILADFDNLSFGDQMTKIVEVSNSFRKERNNYSYLEAIAFYGNQGLILKNSSLGNGNIYYENSPEDWFYSSDIHDEMSDNSLKLKWFGGYTDEDFGLQAEEEESKYYITAVRNIMSKKGQLVFTVEMDYFSDIFYANSEETVSSIYIVDSNGVIVAAKDPGIIGTKRNFSDGETVQEGVLRFEEDSEQGRMQVLVYHLSALGWSLVNEIPIVEVTRESIYLRNILLITCFLSVVASVLFSMRWIRSLLNPLNRLMGVMQKVGEGELGATLEDAPRNEIGVVTREFNRMSTELEDMFARNRQIEEEKRNLEIQTLRSQINPHLIYNTLNTIKWMALIEGERNIAESISLLSDFLEPVFKNKSLMCTVGEELDYVKKYIAIMNLRNAGGYVLETVVSEEYLNCQIPRFLLQPIVENSILHGLEDRCSGKIRISMEVEGENGFLLVEDDGSGMDESQLQELQAKLDWAEENRHTGIGIGNVHSRLKLQYGDGYGVKVYNRVPKGMAVRLKIRLEISK